jgi:hypothetical protein
MNNVKAIDVRIEALRTELERVEGTKTEIYARIVGYYRSLKNWNRGKREEFNHRVTYRPNRTIRSAETAPVLNRTDDNPVSEETAPAGSITSYAYFYRETCPRCPSVKSYMEGLSLSGKAIDVDTGEGMSAAVDYQILSTPTVVLFDEAGHRVADAGSVEQLRGILESAG